MSPTTAEKSFLVVNVLADGGVFSLAEVATRTGLPKSTAHRMLQSLERVGFADAFDGQYGIGWRLRSLAERSAGLRPSALRNLLVPYLLDLFVTTGNAVHLGVMEDVGVLCVERLHGHRSVPLSIRMGSILPAHRTAMGKVLLAYRPNTNADDATSPVEGELAAAAAHRELGPQLDQVRHTGVAVEVGRFQTGVACVAAPIWGPGRTIVAAISVCGNTDVAGNANIERAVRDVAHQASRAIVPRDRA